MDTDTDIDFDDVGAPEDESNASDVPFEKQVSEAIAKMTQDDKGLWQIPEDLPEEVAYAAMLEKRRRDTQSAYAKATQELEALKAVNEQLSEKLEQSFTAQLSEEQLAELDELKELDPEQYYVRRREFEQQAKQEFEEELSSLDYSQEEVEELSSRAQLLTEFLEDNPGLVLNDDVFQNDLPPRITGKLESGEITFAEFLEEAKAFLSKSVKVDTDEDVQTDEPDLSKASGSDQVPDAVLAKDATESYLTEVY